ncbi:putative ABC transport system ATP-binding protein [Rhizobium sp. RU35A]|uniref:ABC transporter ATP-binding protein n=1 Tax=Rhizobium sp. RU35A TaxID=1907414 RepID=UPI0009572C6F|nr:ATP-binding cassette domain-containing protein [Rhizobium sp. RU35A]SIR08447.1 putative ABC transport system ATP-binding protein [Rhizobium sp. RU35A]
MLTLSIENLVVRVPDLQQPVLVIDRLDVAAGQHLAVTGGSGSGKSTFLNILSGLERVREGRVLWNASDIAPLSESGRDRWRARNVGLVMQDFHLFPGLTALANVLLPARLAGAADAAILARAHDLLARVDLSRPDQRIETMSRGEMQRVAIARALLRRPGVIIADEPTASLDVESGAAVGDLLLEVAAETRSTLIVASHDPRLVERLDRRLSLAAGRIVADNAASEVAA